MMNKEHLINQHILEYESRLKHIDELLAKTETDPNLKQAQLDDGEELKKIKEKRNELEDYIHAVKKVPVDDWEKSEFNLEGPMVVWDLVAQQLEKLIELKR